MLAFIRGKVIQKQPGFLIIENNGLGYQVFVLTGNFKLNQEIELYLYHQIRENEQSLYGFFSLDERQVFELLLSISGIGPKKALEILGKVDYKVLVEAVRSEDKKTLNLNGLTPIMADKVLTGLKRKIKQVNIAGEASSVSGNDDVITALQGLGYQDKEIFVVVKELDNSLAIELRIKQALSLLANGN